MVSVTFIIPCFNHGRFVQQAVASCLAQEGADARVVVVNDGSTDRATAAACDACSGDRVTVIHQENRGLPAARNRGAAGATGEFLAFLDADDWVEPAFASRLASAIGAERASGRGEDVSHAYCQERLVEKGQGIWRVPEWDPLLMMITNIHPVTALVRRDRFEAVGGFTESMTGGYEDWDLWLKFVGRGWRGVRVREPLFVWRRHSASTMIMNVIHNHEALYAQIMASHRALYERHGAELLLRTNSLLRRCDMNWLDESGDPINLRALKRQREMYESMAAVRLHHALHRAIGGLPAPLRRAALKTLHGAKRLIGARPVAQGPVK
jgi:glycosyltransferase involved in cell wall biosynthesis